MTALERLEAARNKKKKEEETVAKRTKAESVGGSGKTTASSGSPALDRLEAARNKKKKEEASNNGRKAPKVTTTGAGPDPIGYSGPVPDVEGQNKNAQRILERQRNRITREAEEDNRRLFSGEISEDEHTKRHNARMEQLNRNERNSRQAQETADGAAAARKRAERSTAVGSLERAKTNSDFEKSVKAGRALAANPSNSGATFEQSKVLEHAQNAIINKNKGGREYGFAEGNMTEDELNTFLYYIGRGDWQNAGRYWDSIEPELNARYAGVRQEWIEEEAEEYPLLGLGRYAIGALDGRGAIATGIAALTGNEIDPNSAAFSSTIDRESINRKFTEQGRAGLGGVGEAIGGDTGRAVGEWLGEQLVGAGLSAVDMGVDALVGGGFASYARGLSMVPRVASATSRDVLQRGGTAQQAITAGALSAVVEYLSEQIPLEQISKTITAYPMTAKQKVVDILLSAGYEGAEEVVSEIAGNVVDALVMQDNSEFNLRVRELMAQGFSKDRAISKAATEFYLINPANAFVGGALAGGGMALGGRVVNATLENEAAFRGDKGAMTLRERSEFRKALQEAAERPQSNESAQNVSQPSGGEDVMQRLSKELFNGQPMTAEEAEIMTTHQIESLNKVAKTTMGEAGATELLKGYTAGTNAATYYGSFSRAYSEGLSGKAMGQNRTTLTDEQYKAAYEAGRKDSAASLAAEKAKANNALVYKTGSGLIENDVSAKLDVKTKKALGRIAKATGTKVELFEYTGDGVHGYIENGVVHIAANSNQGVIQIAAHEITHQMQELAPEEYRKFRDFAVQARAQNIDGGVGALVASYQKRYSKKTTLTAEQAMDEAAADYTRDLIEHSEAFDELARKDRTVAQWFVESVNAFLKKVASVFTGKEARDRAVMGQFGTSYETLRKAAELWDATLKATERQVERAQERTEEKSTALRGGARLSFVGANEYGVEVYETSEEVLRMPYKQRMEVFMDLMRNEYRGRTAKFVADGSVYYAKFDEADLRKNVYGDKRSSPRGWKAKVSTGADGNIFELVENARYDYGKEEIGKTAKAHKDVTDWEYFVKTVQIDGRVYDLLANVRKKPEGEYVYSIQLNENKNKTPAPPRRYLEGNAEADNRPIGVPTDVSGDIVAETEDSVKRYSLEDSEGRTLSDQQVEYFKHSKVRDRNGNLKVMYHGTDAKFTVFDRAVLSDKLGFFFTEDRTEASDYGDQMECYLNIEHPFDMFGETSIEDYLGGEPKYVNGEFNYEAAVNGLIKAGYDGVYSYSHGTEWYIAFSSEQIKLTTNKNPTDSQDIRYSLEDSEGRTLTEKQQEFFANSQVRDKNGNLRVMYRGDPEAFTVFDRAKTKHSNLYGRGFYFTDSPSHAGQYGNTREFYLNITNPLTPGAHAITKAQMRKFLKAVAENEDDYSFENYGYDATVESVLESIYGKGDFEALYDVALTAVGGLVETAELFNKITGTTYDGIIVDTETVAFRPEQIKRTDNENPTNDLDIRYSYETPEAAEAARLERENAQLRERVEYWKGQTKRTRGSVVDLRTAKAAAKRLVKDFDADVDVDQLTEKIRDLYKSMGGKGGQVDYEALRRMADDIATEIAETATGTDDEAYTMYQDLRKDLKQMTLNVSARDAENIPDFIEWRKQYKGKLKIAVGPTNIDQQMMDLAQQYPELFEEYLDVYPVDQLMRIAEVADAISTVSQTNPYERNMAEAVNEIGNEVLLRVMDLPSAAPTFADKQAKAVQDARLAGQMAQGREDAVVQRRERERLERRLAATGRRLDEVRRARDEQLREIVERNKEGRAKRKESNATKELRAKILRHTRKLSEKLLRPTDKQHIPDEFRKTVAAALEAINLESAYDYDPATMRITSNNAEIGDRVEKGTGRAANRTKAFLTLKEQYAKIGKEESELVVDPDLLGVDNVKGLFDQVLEMSDIPINTMNSEQLGIIWKVVKSLEHAVSTAGKTLADTRWADIHAAAREFYDQNYKKSGKRYLGAKRETLNLQDPVTFFHNFGDAGMELFHLLRKAQDIQRLMREDIKNRFAKIVSGKNAYQWEKNAHEFTTERGAKLVLTEAQIMDLYLLSQRKQAEGHLMVGGVTQPEVKSKGVKRDGGLIKLTNGDLETIFSKLSEEQITVAKSLQELTSTVLSKYGNDASMKVYGYRKFLGTDYWPIRVAGEDLKTQPGASADVVKTVKNLGMTKAVVPEAKNGIELGSVFDVFSSHASDMEMYSSWLAATEDAMRLFNYRFREEDGYDNGGRDVSVKELMDKVAGVGAQKYFKTLMDDLQNGLRANGDDFSTGINSVIGKTRGASVGGNIRVIVQQPTAALRAMAEMNPRDLAAGAVKGVTKGSGWKKALKYSPIAMQKAAGGVDISTGWSLKSELLGPEKALDKVNEAMMKGAAAADAVTWGRLWNAAEHQVHRQQSDLRPGSEEFYAAVNEVFSDVVDKTQVVDGVLQRSQLMRSPSDLSKMATAFMGEPTKTLNMMIRAYDDFRLNSGKERSVAAKKALRVGAALLVTDVVNAFMQSLVDGLRDEDEDEKYWERVWAAMVGKADENATFTEKLWAHLIGGNVAQQINPVGRIPYAKDVLSIAQGFTVERSDMAFVADVIDAAKAVQKSIQGESKQTVLASVKNLVSVGSRLFGLSFGNVVRDITGVVKTVAVEREDLAFLYEMQKLETDIGSGKANNVFFDYLYKAKETGDQELYEKIYRDMLDADITEKQIRNGMEARAKKAQGVEEVSELEKRWMNPKDEAEYDDIMGDIFESAEWKAANADDRAWMKGKVFDLATETKAGIKLQNRLDDITETTGVSETEYLLLMLAEQMVSEEAEESNGSATVGDYVDVLYDLYTSGDIRYNSAYNRVIASGVDEKKIRSGMESRMKEAANVESVDDLGRRYLAPDEEAVYERLMNKIGVKSTYLSLPAEEREYVDSAVYSIAIGNEDGVKMQSAINKAKGYGVSEEDYVIQHVTFNSFTSDYDNNGRATTTKQSKFRAWLNKQPWSESAKDYIWSLHYKSRR